MRKYFIGSQTDAECVNCLSETVTRTWVECEISSIQMTRQQEIFLALILELTIKTIVKFTAASLLALSAIAPALAAEENTLHERSGAIVNSQHLHHAHRGIDAYASTGTVSGNPYDFGIKGQGIDRCS